MIMSWMSSRRIERRRGRLRAVLGRISTCSFRFPTMWCKSTWFTTNHNRCCNGYSAFWESSGIKFCTVSLTQISNYRARKFQEQKRQRLRATTLPTSLVSKINSRQSSDSKTSHFISSIANPRTTMRICNHPPSKTIWTCLILFSKILKTPQITWLAIPKFSANI